MKKLESECSNYLNNFEKNLNRSMPPRCLISEAIWQEEHGKQKQVTATSFIKFPCKLKKKTKI